MAINDKIIKILLNHMRFKTSQFIILLDSNLTVTELNSHAISMLDVSVGDKLESFTSHYTPEQADERVNLVHYRMSDGRFTSLVTNTYYTDGQYIMVSEPFSKEIHKLNTNIISMNNQLNEATREINRQKFNLIELNEQKNQLMGMLAHDMRNPLNSIHLMCELLKMSDSAIPADELNNYLINIINQISYLNSLVNDALTMSSIDAGKVTLNTEEIDINELVQQCVESHRLLAGKVNIDVKAEKASEGIMISCDKNKIKQVLDNLIGNAVKFSEHGQAVKVKTYKESEDVFISVKDNGEGIPKESINSIFKPFESTAMFSKRGEKNTGLGLAICKKIVEAHNGEITVSSKEGEGAEFIFRLPCNKPA